jgi:hypothetical protein
MSKVDRRVKNGHGRPVTPEEEERMVRYWQAGFSEEYIVQVLGRDRGVIRRRVEARGLPCLHTIRHKRAQEWLEAQEAKERSGSDEPVLSDDQEEGRPHSGIEGSR